MIISLVIGILLGSLSVVFALQNVAMVTVTFLAWQISAPLALVLLGSMLSGVVITLLVSLPSLIRDEMSVKVLRKQKKQLEDELAAYRTPTATVVTETATHTVV
jgi:putative membrane protein